MQKNRQHNALQIAVALYGIYQGYLRVAHYHAIRDNRHGMNAAITEAGNAYDSFISTCRLSGTRPFIARKAYEKRKGGQPL